MFPLTSKVNNLKLRDESDNEFQKHRNSVNIEELVLEEIETKKKEVYVKIDTWRRNK